MDPIEALLDPVYDEQKLAALAQQLRGQKQAADFFALSTIDPISNMAQGRQKEILGVAEQQGILRKALADRQAQEQRAIADREARAAEGEANRQNRLYSATLKASGKKNAEGAEAVPEWGSGYASEKERTALDEKGKAHRNFKNMKSTYNTAWVPVVPGISGRIETSIGRNIPEGLVPDRMISPEKQEELKKKATWWSTYERNVAIPLRKLIFGSQFTAPERVIFDRANVTENMDPQYVKRYLDIQADVVQRDAEAAIIDGYMSTDSKGRRRYSKESLSNKFGKEIVDRTLDLFSKGEYDIYRQDRIDRLNDELLSIEKEQGRTGVPVAAESSDTPEAQTAEPVTKTINGKTYIQIDGQWYEQ